MSSLPRNKDGTFMSGFSYSVPTQYKKGGVSPNFKHGMEGTRLYRIYEQMRARCLRKTSPAYKWYGDRGIRCEWEDFVSFMRDMRESYDEHVRIYGTKDTQIDRIDNNGNYSKENCRWATSREQGKNRRDNVRLTYNGETQTISDWARKVGMANRTLWARLNRGWSLEKSLTKPLRKTGK